MDEVCLDNVKSIFLKYHVSYTNGKISIRIKIGITFIYRLHSCPNQLVLFFLVGLFFCIVFVFLFVFVLMGWSLLLNALRPTEIYCAPPNLGVTRTWICRLNFAQRPIFSGLRFFNEPEISDSGPPA